MNLEKIIYNSIPILLITLFLVLTFWLCIYYNNNFRTEKEKENEDEIKNKYLLKESDLTKGLMV